MKKLLLSLIVMLLLWSIAFSQQYIGAGNNNGITVTYSHQYLNPDWPKSCNGNNLVNGSGLDAKIKEASRFLTQATLGFEESHIDDVVSLGIDAWIDDQIQKPQTEILPKTYEVWDIRNEAYELAGGVLDTNQIRPPFEMFNYAWWDLMMRNEDLLRHRVAVALSEIIVISRRGNLSNFGDGLGSYYDLLAKHAFGNFEDLLYDVTLHPMMGSFLSHLNNAKADYALNTHPDENYAREIMQLFSIGLYELNLDGTRKTLNGEFIPTYGQDDIREFAKVFTGLSMGGLIENPWPYGQGSLYFNRPIGISDATVPMKMHNWKHDGSQKNLLGVVSPAAQDGLLEIAFAINVLFNHENVGPFISHLLIQRLVKSNPSPEYIARVASVFNSNENGIRGDLGATVKAILTDREARTCSAIQSDLNSKVKEPIIRYTQFARFANKFNAFNYWWNSNKAFQDATAQDLLDAPSVFNFFLPDHSPSGDIGDANLVAPELQIHNSFTGPGFINEVYRWTNSDGNLMDTKEQASISESTVIWDLTNIRSAARDPENLINELDKILTFGSLSKFTRSEIKSTLKHIVPSNEYDYLEERARLGVYLFLISPDYSIMR